MKGMIKKLLQRMGYDVKKIPKTNNRIPDARFYKPLFYPWLGYGNFNKIYSRIKTYSLISPDRCYVLYSLASQALSLPGDIWECGVYKGGTAILFAELIASIQDSKSKLHLFDTFMGLPETDKDLDLHRMGDFDDTSLEAVRKRVGMEDIVRYHEGLIPRTFTGLDNSKISFAHIDVDLYQSVTSCCKYITPKLVEGEFIVFDDYGFPSCPGARRAVDEFFETRNEKPLVLHTGEAVIFKSHSAFSGCKT